MKLIIGLAAMLAMAAPQQQQLSEPAPRLQRIEMQSFSWGRSVSHWSIDAHGNFQQTRPEPNAFKPERIVTRSYAAGTAGFRRMRVLLGVPETRAGHRMPCTITMTDQVSGTVKWVQPNGRTRTLDFYTACRESTTSRVVDQLGKAEQLAKEWARMGEVTEARPGDGGQ